MPLRSLQRGVTAMELLITLTIIGIMCGLAAPSFLEFVRNNRAQAQSGTLFRALNYARAESIRRGVDVYVTANSGGNDWTSGWHVWVDTNGDAAYTAGTDTDLQTQDAFSGEGSLAGTLAQLVFAPSGRLDGVAAGTDYTFQYRQGTTGYCNLARNIHINFMGRVYLKAEGC